MPDILNVPFYSASSTVTFMKITGYSLVPRTTVQGTHVTITVVVGMRGSSALYTHTTDLAFGRKVIGTINGYSIGEHLIKRHALDRWEKNSDNSYSIEVDLPYSPGTLFANLRIVPEGAGSSAYMTTSTFTTGTNAYTMYSDAGVAPSPPSAVLLAGAESLTVAQLTGYAILSWTPPIDGTGGVMSYDIYYMSQSVGWTYLCGTDSLLDYYIDLSNFGMGRGSWIAFAVRSIGLYGPSAINGMPYLWLAQTPSNVAALVVAPNPANYRGDLSLSWGAPNANSGTISKYGLLVKHLPKGGAWSIWTSLPDVTITSATVTPVSLATPLTAGPGSQYQFRIIAYNSYDLASGFTDSSVILMKSGIMKAKVSGTYIEGTGYVKVGGAWKEASNVYIKVGGVWKESIA